MIAVKSFIQKIFTKNLQVFLKIFCYLSIIFILQTTIAFVLINRTLTNSIRANAHELTSRVIHDINFANGQWDISRYNADPSTPYPNGSSGFLTPLYIFTSDGFVIERNQPIPGYLDSSDFKHLIVFTTPQTITAVTGEKWRVYSKPIMKDQETLGVIMVSYYNPQPAALADIDKILLDNSERLSGQVMINENNVLMLHNVDVRNIHYEVSFEIVNTFNKVLLNNGRTPSFIDTSYIAKESEQTGYKTIKNSNSKETYYIYSEKLYDSSTKQFKGLVVSAISTSTSNEFFWKFFGYLIGTEIVMLPILSFTLYYYHNRHIHSVLGQLLDSQSEQQSPIRFDAKKGIAYINGQRYFLPLESKQYYLAEALFSDPDKLWDQEELLKRIGEEPLPENWRKVYDAMLALNKKFGKPLIIQKNRNYTIQASML